MNLPIGQVNDQIACWQIAKCGAKEEKLGRDKKLTPKSDHELFWNS